MSLSVAAVRQSETWPALLETHYAKRIPSISHAFGLFDGGEPVGYVTYGSPSSAPLRAGIAGPDNAHLVLELNRLVLFTETKNAASLLVGRSLKLLPKPAIVVSYADCGQGHVGYVYQACNFLYTGLSAKRTDWKVKGLEGMHGQSIVDISKPAAGMGKGARADFMRRKFGDDFYLQDRDRKHRYIFICASRRDKARLTESLRYPVEPYPKGESRRYEAGPPETEQKQLFRVGE